jgi:hypothetical protein
MFLKIRQPINPISLFLNPRQNKIFISEGGSPELPNTRIKIVSVKDHANNCTDLQVLVERQKYNIPLPLTQCIPEDVKKQGPHYGGNLSPTADKDVYKLWK